MAYFVKAKSEIPTTSVALKKIQNNKNNQAKIIEVEAEYKFCELVMQIKEYLVLQREIFDFGLDIQLSKN